MKIPIKLTIILLSVICLQFYLTTDIIAQDKPSEKTIYSEPVLLTSAGQAADVMILLGLSKRAGIDVVYRPQANADSLKDVKCIILVSGGSSKGMGAAKVDPKDEAVRIDKLIKAAKSAKLPVIVFHIGGEARRGALSDPFNKIAAEAGEHLFIVKGGDDDNFFKKIATSKKAKYTLIEKQATLVDTLKELFGKTEPKPE